MEVPASQDIESSQQSGEIEQVAQQAETDCGDEDEGQVSQ